MNRKVCPFCKNPYRPTQRWTKHCGAIDCQHAWAMKHLEQQKAKQERQRTKEAAARARKEREEIKARKEAIKTVKELLPEAQDAFNAYIRFRDRFELCIDCGKPFQPGTMGGSVDAGHFRSRAAAPHLRFHEDNCHAQRKSCNMPGGTTYSKYRAGLVERIGEARVLALEADNDTTHKWTREEVIRIRDHYRAKLRDLKRKSANDYARPHDPRACI